MRRVLPVSVVAFSILLGSALAPALAVEGKLYGKPLSGSEITLISDLLETPDRYVGETVRVEGLVTRVCEKRGCWISLASDQEFQELRIKARDGVIVFPVQARGKKAVAEGVFTKIELDMEQTLRQKQHHAEEHGEAFDPASVTEPTVYYQINVTGAVIR
jgi:hypothetical protein